MNKIKKEIKKVTGDMKIKRSSGSGNGAEIMAPSTEENHKRVFRIFFPLDMRRWYYEQYTEIVSLPVVSENWNVLMSPQTANRCYEESDSCECAECTYYKKYVLPNPKEQYQGKKDGILSLVIERALCEPESPPMWRVTCFFEQKSSGKFFTVFQFEDENRPSIEDFTGHDECEFF